MKYFIRPCYADGKLYADYELPQAFNTLDIPFPQCPCATQETSSTKKHYYEIWVVQTGQFTGKVAAACAKRWNGCNTWRECVCLIFYYPISRYLQFA